MAGAACLLLYYTCTHAYQMALLLSNELNSWRLPSRRNAAASLLLSRPRMHTGGCSPGQAVYCRSGGGVSDPAEAADTHAEGQLCGCLHPFCQMNARVTTEVQQLRKIWHLTPTGERDWGGKLDCACGRPLSCRTPSPLCRNRQLPRGMGANLSGRGKNWCGSMWQLRHKLQPTELARCDQAVREAAHWPAGRGDGRPQRTGRGGQLAAERKHAVRGGGQ
jgi:hypothetical protein